MGLAMMTRSVPSLQLFESQGGCCSSKHCISIPGKNKQHGNISEEQNFHRNPKHISTIYHVPLLQICICLFYFTLFQVGHLQL